MRFFVILSVLIIQNSCSNSSKRIKSKSEQKLVDISQLKKVSEMLDEDIYWEIVDESVSKTNTPEAQEKYLISKISKLSPNQIIGFRLRTDKLLYDTYSSELWCAGYIMNQGCTDDGFEYFRNWIISRGKKTYYYAKEDPDYLINEVDKIVYGYYEFEPFWYVALEAFVNKTGKNLYDYI